MAHERPRLHLTTSATWLNDPNGLVRRDGVWHAYYQTNPHDVVWGSMSWGHSTSRDLVTWEEHPVAIGNLGDGEDVYSGSVVVDHEGRAGFGTQAMVAVFTSNHVPPHPRAGTSAQSLAWSLDGHTWTRHDANPVLCRSSRDFRDPKVFWSGDGWVMVAVEAEEKAVLVYRSDDLRTWQDLSRFEWPLPWAGCWECPDLVRLTTGDGETADVLLLSVNPGHPQGGSGTLAVVGSFDGRTFTAAEAPPASPQAAPWLDRGRDHYAAVTFAEVDDRVVALGWMSSWDYARHVPLTGGRGAMTLPRELGLARVYGRLRVTVRPAREVEAALAAPPAGVQVLRLDAREPASYEVTATARVEVGEGTVAVTRTGDWHPLAPCTTTAALGPATRELLVVADTCSVEVFSDDGLVALTNLAF